MTCSDRYRDPSGPGALHAEKAFRERPGRGPDERGYFLPADRARELADELEPALTLMDGVQAECAQIIDAAEREAAAITEAARQSVTVSPLPRLP